jgi:ATP-dependent helicase/nuclease subunit A
VYPHEKATQTPSKQTATQLKGRAKDQEAAENTAEKAAFMPRTFRKPSFEKGKARGVDYGNAVHAVMQHIQLSCCDDIDSIRQELVRLEAEHLVTAEQIAMVDPQIIFDLFDTELGSRMRTATTVLREFKFSVLEDAQIYVPGLTGEKILLQGVVDFAIIDDDGITVIDFKTDSVTAETLPALEEEYGRQVAAYTRSLEQIYGLPVKSAWLYFFRLKQFVCVSQ